MVNVFFDIGVIIIAATLAGFIAKLLKQPLIPAYILGGILVGPSVLGLITDIGTVKTLAEIGIAFMLFIVGLEVDFKRIKSIGTFAAIGGTIQIALLFLLGFLIALGTFANGIIQTIYLGIIVMFSGGFVTTGNSRFGNYCPGFFSLGCYFHFHPFL